MKTVQVATGAIRPMVVTSRKVLRWTRQSAPDIEVLVPLDTEVQATLWYDSVRYNYTLHENDAVNLYNTVKGPVEVRCGTQFFTVVPA